MQASRLFRTSLRYVAYEIVSTPKTAGAGALVLPFELESVSAGDDFIPPEQPTSAKIMKN